MTRADATPWTRSVESTKTTDAHRAKLAVVYVRQSTPQQVAENRESLARQYALADHAISLGWPTERVLVIDEDLGLSGRTADMRLGFQRLLAEVSMDHVGLVLGLEMSRLLAYGSYRIRRCDAFSLAEDARLSRPFEGIRTRMKRPLPSRFPGRARGERSRLRVRRTRSRPLTQARAFAPTASFCPARSV